MDAQNGNEPQEYDIDEEDGPRSKWVTYAPGKFLVQYRNAMQTDSFRRRIQAKGIAKFTRDGRFEANPGRQLDWFIALAEFYVTDWRQVKYDGKSEYSAEGMGKAMSKSNGLLELILQTVQENETFFDRAESGSTPS